MVDMETEIENVEVPDGVELNFIEFSQEVECVIDTGDGELVLVDDVDPIYDQVVRE